MSATRDKSQKITFVYSNLYAIYRKGVERARQGATQDASEGSPSRGAQALNELAGLRTAAQSFESGLVIKAKDLRTEPGVPSQAAAERACRLPLPPSAPQGPQGQKIRAYTPAELLGKRIAAKPAAGNPGATPEAVASLKQNLQSLNNLQERLRFMLQELEQLVKE